MFIKFDERGYIESFILSHWIVAICAVFTLIWVSSSFFTVEPWEVVLVKTLWQITPTTYKEWPHFKTPFVGKVITINTRGKKVDEYAQASTNDLQKVWASISIVYAIRWDDGVMTVYRKIWDDNPIADNVAKPNIREAVRSVFANYKADELITKRTEVSDAIASHLKEKLNEFGVDVTDVNISTIDFSEDFNSAIETKVKTEQEALAKKNELEKTKYESEQAVIQAQARADSMKIEASAQAEAIRIQSEAIRQNGWENYVKLKWIEKWNWAVPVTSLGTQDVIMNLK